MATSFKMKLFRDDIALGDIPELTCDNAVKTNPVLVRDRQNVNDVRVSYSRVDPYSEYTMFAGAGERISTFDVGDYSGNPMIAYDDKDFQNGPGNSYFTRIIHAHGNIYVICYRHTVNINFQPAYIETVHIGNGVDGERGIITLIDSWSFGHADSWGGICKIAPGTFAAAYSRAYRDLWYFEFIVDADGIIYPPSLNEYGYYGTRVGGDYGGWYGPSADADCMVYCQGGVAMVYVEGGHTYRWHGPMRIVWIGRGGDVKRVAQPTGDPNYWPMDPFYFTDIAEPNAGYYPTIAKGWTYTEEGYYIPVYLASYSLYNPTRLEVMMCQKVGLGFNILDTVTVSINPQFNQRSHRITTTIDSGGFPKAIVSYSEGYTNDERAKTYYLYYGYLSEADYKIFPGWQGGSDDLHIIYKDRDKYLLSGGGYKHTIRVQNDGTIGDYINTMANTDRPQSTVRIETPEA